MKRQFKWKKMVVKILILMASPSPPRIVGHDRDAFRKNRKCISCRFRFSLSLTRSHRIATKRKMNERRIAFGCRRLSPPKCANRQIFISVSKFSEIAIRCDEPWWEHPPLSRPGSHIRALICILSIVCRFTVNVAQQMSDADAGHARSILIMIYLEALMHWCARAAHIRCGK